MAARSFWLTVVCVVCLIVFVVEIQCTPTETRKNQTTTTNSTNGATNNIDDETCDLDPEPEAEPSANKHAKNATNNATKAHDGSDRQAKDIKLDLNDKAKYTHDGAPEPEPESGAKNGTKEHAVPEESAKASNASLNNQGNKPGQSSHDQKESPTAGKSTAGNTTSTTPAPEPGSAAVFGMSSSVLSLTTLALFACTILVNGQC